MNEHDDAYVDAMLMINMQANTRSVTPAVNTRENGFELKPVLITMVQASQFCGKAHEDASAHLQHFL